MKTAIFNLKIRAIPSVWLLILGLNFLLLLQSCKILSPEADSSEPIIVFTFDDQHSSIYNVAYPILKEHGYKGTNFINSAAIGIGELMTWEQIRHLELNEGWETGGHTLHHEALNQISLEEAIRVIQEDYDNLLQHGLNPHSFALPRGQCPSQVYPFLRSLYTNIRGSSDFGMYAPLNRHALGYLAFQTGWTAQQVKQRILRGIAQRESLIIIGFHHFDVEMEGYMDSCTTETLIDIMDFCHEKQLKVLPLHEAVEAVRR